MFVQTEFVRKSSASHTLQCYSNRNEFLEHYPSPLIELKRSHSLMFIGTLFQFYQWAVDNVLGVHFYYCSTEEYERQKIFLQTRFEQT